MLGLHTFAVMAEQDERGELLAGGFIEQVRSSGGTVVANLRYSPDANNFENQMAYIQRYLPDGIYLTAKSDMITQLASQVHYYGMGGVQLIGGEVLGQRACDPHGRRLCGRRSVQLSVLR